jgi:hypothetical protein
MFKKGDDDQVYRYLKEEGCYSRSRKKSELYRGGMYSVWRVLEYPFFIGDERDENTDYPLHRASEYVEQLGWIAVLVMKHMHT